MNLQVGRTYLIRHKSMFSPWITADIIGIGEDGLFIITNPEQNFYEHLTDDYEIKEMKDLPKIEAKKAWMERASRDMENYDNEANAFEYYWHLTH